MKLSILPDRLRAVRAARQLSQSELAQKANLRSGRKQIQRIEHNKGAWVVRENTLTQLARVLEVDPRVLTGEADLPGALAAPSVPTRTPANAVPLHREHEHKLVILDDGFAIFEFAAGDPLGKLVARGIKDKAAGLRLADSGTMRRLLRQAYWALTDAEQTGGIPEEFSTFEEWEAFNIAVLPFIRGRAGEPTASPPAGLATDAPAPSEDGYAGVAGGEQ